MANSRGAPKGRIGKARGGRPKGSKSKVTLAIREAAREYTTEALERLAQLMRAKDFPAVSHAAASTLLAYGWGRPTQSVEATVNTQQQTQRELLVQWLPRDDQISGRGVLIASRIIDAVPKEIEPPPPRTEH
jgi:hypothetical protein